LYQAPELKGTQALLSDLFIYEAAESEPQTIADVKEVLNYVHAMNYGCQLLKKLPISQ